MFESISIIIIIKFTTNGIENKRVINMNIDKNNILEKEVARWVISEVMSMLEWLVLRMSYYNCYHCFVAYECIRDKEVNRKLIIRGIMQ